MVNNKNSELTGFILNRAIFRLVVTVLLVAFGWLAGWYLQGHSISSWRESNYFTDPFRIAFLVFLLVEAVIITFLAPRTAQVTDERARSWYHSRLVMWETLLVLSVFSDCMRILPIGAGSSPRWIGIALLLIGLLLYACAGASRRLEFQRNPQKPFPTGGHFQGDTLSRIACCHFLCLWHRLGIQCLGWDFYCGDLHYRYCWFCKRSG